MTLVMNAAWLALLQDMDDREVWYDSRGGVVNTAIPPGRNVLAEATRLRREGLADVDFDAERLGAYPYVLTDAGRAALAAGLVTGPATEDAGDAVR